MQRSCHQPPHYTPTITCHCPRRLTIPLPPTHTHAPHPRLRSPPPRPRPSPPLPHSHPNPHDPPQAPPTTSPLHPHPHHPHPHRSAPHPPPDPFSNSMSLNALKAPRMNSMDPPRFKAASGSTLPTYCSTILRTCACSSDVSGPRSSSPPFSNRISSFKSRTSWRSLGGWGVAGGGWGGGERGAKAVVGR